MCFLSGGTAYTAGIPAGNLFSSEDAPFEARILDIDRMVEKLDPIITLPDEHRPSKKAVRRRRVPMTALKTVVAQSEDDQSNGEDSDNVPHVKTTDIERVDGHELLELVYQDRLRRLADQDALDRAMDELGPDEPTDDTSEHDEPEFDEEDDKTDTFFRRPPVKRSW